MHVELPVYPRGSGFIDPESIVAVAPFAGPGGVVLASVNMMGGERIVVNASIEDTCRALKLRLAKCGVYGSDVDIFVKPEAVTAISDHPQNPCTILYFKGGRMANVNGTASQIHKAFQSPVTPAT